MAAKMASPRRHAEVPPLTAAAAKAQIIPATTPAAMEIGQGERPERVRPNAWVGVGMVAPRGASRSG
ncbi:hypothetical protein [Micropruina glycogenica]|uniref:hypothetical protein n=1 Tax=Micropruina glycogenica TaxID=75385 RepID=UPI001319EFF9|nr:hypothetical protein [Micropruina glycogenica]